MLESPKAAKKISTYDRVRVRLRARAPMIVPTASISLSVRAVAKTKLLLMLHQWPSITERINSPALAGKQLLPRYATMLAQKTVSGAICFSAPSRTRAQSANEETGDSNHGSQHEILEPGSPYRLAQLIPVHTTKREEEQHPRQKKRESQKST